LKVEKNQVKNMTGRIQIQPVVSKITENVQTWFVGTSSILNITPSVSL